MESLAGRLKPENTFDDVIGPIHWMAQEGLWVYRRHPTVIDFFASGERAEFESENI
jgi:hypothetical protein